MNYFYKIFYKLKVLWESITYVPDFTVSRVSLTYVSDACVDVDGIDSLWVDESKYWDTIDGHYHWDITSQYRQYGMARVKEIMRMKPEEVTDMVLTIRYSYSTSIYKFVTSDPDFLWTPDRNVGEGMTFKFPISEAWVLDVNGRQIIDITHSLQKAAGPRSDFHNQDVRVRDVVIYDYPTIEVKTMLNSNIYSEDDSVLLI